MKSILLLIAACALTAGSGLASPGPMALAPTPPIAAPQDRPYPGVITLSVDASDTDRRIVRVHETIPVSPPVAGGGSDVVLLYPEWLPGTHAPEGAIDRLAGLVVSAGGTRLTWTRDVANPYAFHVAAPAGVSALDVTFQYLSPVTEKVGPVEITSTIAALEWIRLVLYPAGYYARDIAVDASLALPPGWKVGTAMERAGAGDGGAINFRRTTLETLADSPVYAGRYFARLDLDPGGAVPVHMDVFADRPSELEVTREQLAAHRALVQQAYKLYGSHHYDHYDFLFSISDLTLQQGLEHHQSSEDGVGAGYFARYDGAVYDRSLLPHEFTHSWNGKFRRPADLWTPNYNVRMRDSLLWVYEGQTEYWGEVLTARTGLRTPEEERDSLAYTAAVFDHVPGRSWRALQDTTNDEIINPRRPLSWTSWQRFEDYYDEGLLIWLDADTLIRERSNGARSLDDFARRFFGMDDASHTPVTYTFDALVKGLNAVEPYDWAGFLHLRVDAVDKPAPLGGLARGGYRLVYDEKDNLLQKSMEGEGKLKDFTFSIGLMVGKDGVLTGVLWDSPAFKAGLTSGMTLLAVNGAPYSDDALADALKAAKTSTAPIELIIKTADRFKVVGIDYHEGLKYPHLQRIPGAPDRLDAILAARK